MLGGRASRSTTPSKQFTIHNGRLALCCRARRSTSYLCYGFREAGPLCETHCKPRSGAAVGKMSLNETSFPEGGLMLLVVSRMYKSRFAEHADTAEFHPQLRRFTACSGLRIEVYLRHTLWLKTCSNLLQTNRRSSVPLDNTDQTLHTFFIMRFGWCCRARRSTSYDC